MRTSLLVYYQMMPIDQHKAAGTGKTPPQPEGADDNRIHREDDRNHWSKGEEAYPGGGVNGPVQQDKHDYKTHYGETAYGGGQHRYDAPATGEDANQSPHKDQTVFGGQQGVFDAQDAPQGARPAPGHKLSRDEGPRDREGAPAREGKAGSRGIIPGAGADKGPPEGK